MESVSLRNYFLNKPVSENFQIGESNFPKTAPFTNIGTVTFDGVSFLPVSMACRIMSNDRLSSAYSRY
jgi:hypothetical protein